MERDPRGHDAVQLVGPDLRVEQAVAQGWTVDHLGLGARYGAVTLVSCEVVARYALQDGGPLGFWRSLGLLQFLLS
ncbi:MAG: hypothetical protein EON54_25645 [Alcaligenaceae bacterium]|nr:MAG: hypothetical protein EON54_25645 [Alcaligenaceae bacterium]